MLEDITDLSQEEIEKIVKSKGWTDLKWHPSDPIHGRERGWILGARPPEYDGPYCDYIDDVVVEIVDKERPFIHMEYRWIKDWFDEDKYRIERRT